MGYRNSFMDNEEYTAQDINLRFSAMFTQGVVLAESGNILAGLNGITGGVATSGVTADSCLVVRDEGGYRICPGIALMEDGSAIIFDRDGHSFECEPYVHNYVYLKRDQARNTINIVVSREAPGGDFVLLAEIDSSGGILDRRKYSALKLKSNQENTLRRFENNYYYTQQYASEDHTMVTGNFTYVIVFGGKHHLSDSDLELNSHEKCICPIVEGEEMRFTMVDSVGKTRCVFCFKKNGRVVETRIEPTNIYSDYSIEFGVI